MPPTRELMFMQALADDINGEVFSFALIVSCVAALSWFRVLAAMLVTETFGVRIVAIIRMISDVVQFLIIYAMQLIAFTMFASMAFFAVPEFIDFYESFLYMFNASFGSYDLGVFDVYAESPTPSLKIIGHFFFFIFLFFNLVLLLNMVIAMMADTYAAMNEIKTGIYNYNVLIVEPQWRMNKHFGGIIALSPPLSPLTVLFLPFYAIFSKNKTVLKGMTSGLKMLNYFFILVIMTAFFIAFNLLLWPFAWLKTCYAKFKLARSGRGPLYAPFLYFLIGLPLLLVLQVPDTFDFIKWSLDEHDPDKRIRDTITKDGFITFFKIIAKVKETGKTVMAEDLILAIRKSMNVERSVFEAIYENRPQASFHTEDTFLDKICSSVVGDRDEFYDPDRCLRTLAVRNLKNFTLMKEVIWASCDVRDANGDEIELKD